MAVHVPGRGPRSSTNALSRGRAVVGRCPTRIPPGAPGRRQRGRRLTAAATVAGRPRPPAGRSRPSPRSPAPRWARCGRLDDRGRRRPRALSPAAVPPRPASPGSARYDDRVPRPLGRPAGPQVRLERHQALPPRRCRRPPRRPARAATGVVRAKRRRPHAGPRRRPVRRTRARTSSASIPRVGDQPADRSSAGACTTRTMGTCRPRSFSTSSGTSSTTTASPVPARPAPPAARPPGDGRSPFSARRRDSSAKTTRARPCGPVSRRRRRPRPELGHDGSEPRPARLDHLAGEPVGVDRTAPCVTSRRATVDLPAPMPPVSPTRTWAAALRDGGPCCAAIRLLPARRPCRSPTRFPP